MGRLPVHIEVKEHPDTQRARKLHPEATGIYVSSNGYQWAGFTLQHKSDIVALRDAINRRLEEI